MYENRAKGANVWASNVYDPIQLMGQHRLSLCLVMQSALYPHHLATIAETIRRGPRRRRATLH